MDTESKVSEAIRKYDEDKRFTYADYASWDDDKRYELIDGIAYLMSAPTEAHQTILIQMTRKLADFLDDKPCKILVAPFDVCLNGKGDADDTVVQPDILIVCDESKLDEKRCNGAPDMAIEIISPSTARNDRFKKLNKYLEAGVREYWIVDPDSKGVTVHTLENGKYIISAYEETETISVNILKGCRISLPDIF